MSTYTQILYQIVFSTKYRKPSLVKVNRDELFKYIWGIHKNHRCHLYRINGVEDHLHIVTHLHPTVALANLVKDIKIASAFYIKQSNIFPDFEAWQEGYSAFTYSIQSKDALIEYVKNQEEHHMAISYIDELKALLKEHDIDFDDKFLE